MKVEVLTSVAGKDFSYSRGIQEVDDDRAKKLIKAGHAKPSGEEKATKKAPENTSTKRKKPKKSDG